MIKDFWKNLNRREKWIVGCGGIAALIILFYIYILAPINKERAQLAKALPDLRLASAEMRSMKAEIASLRQNAGASLANSLTDDRLLSVVRAGARAPGFVLGNVSLTGNGKVSLSLKKAGLINFLQMVQQLRLTHGVALETATASLLPDGSYIRVQAEFIAL